MSLVYSTDPALNEPCLRCHKPRYLCACVPSRPFEELVQLTKKASVKIIKAPRAGKWLTQIDHLPPDKDFLFVLMKLCKKACATGGGASLHEGEGRIELQGAHQERVREILVSLPRGL